LDLGLHNFSVRKHYISQLVSILAYLREQRVVHRDLKPANILLNERWQLVLADFGTAKVLNELDCEQARHTMKKCLSNNQLLSGQANLMDESVSSSSSQDSFNEEEEMVGTEDYISPEAITCGSTGGKEVTFASDLWSLGVIIW